MKFFILVFSLFPSISNSQINYFEIGDTLTVLAKSGLSLRDNFSIGSNKLSTVQFGDKVVVISAEYHGDYIDERYGSWIKVKHQGNSGYMFSGFLSYLKLPPAFLAEPGCCRYPYLEEIIRYNIDSVVSKGERNWNSFWEKSYRRAQWELCNDGTLIQYLSYYESSDLVIETYNITMYDMLNLLEHYLANLPESCKTSEIGPYRVEIIKEDRFIESINCEKLWIRAQSMEGKLMIVSNIFDL